MDGFADNFDQAEVDPAAEFIAREQNELAGLDDDISAAPAAPVPVITNDEDPFGLPRAQDEEQDPFASFGQSQAVPLDSSDVKNSPFDSHTMMTSPFDPEGDTFDQSLQDKNELFSEDLVQDDFQNQEGGQNSFGDAPSENQLASADPAEEESPSPAHRPTLVREEPEKIKKWREEQKTRLEEKDANEEKKREEWQEAAKKELEEWYRHHDDLIAKTRSANRNAEKQFVADDEEIEPGTEWERIAKHCDFNPKASKGSKDVSRMRSIILQLKQNPLPVNGFGNKRS
ncbi:clathrin light chain B isoform X2 [Thrips palmi]|uniref:Clathrin light chain n=1 Tax=Thrips palmi TaxID=161013 RepID=A0A6P8ZZC5_THRPL|nr:clathrin light chain B isoform X2 [Thrips palmi]